MCTDVAGFLGALMSLFAETVGGKLTSLVKTFRRSSEDHGLTR